MRVVRHHIVEACEASLRRLNVDYIDRTHYLAGMRFGRRCGRPSTADHQGKIIYVAAVPSRRIAMIRL